MLNLILFLAFASIAILTYILVKSSFVKQKAISRLGRYTNVEEIKEEKRKSPATDYRASFSALSKSIGNLSLFDGYKKSVRKQLVRAHIVLKPEESITLSISLMIIAALLIAILTNNGLYAAAGGISGWLAPSFVIKSKVKKRMKILNDQLSDSIVLISNSLKAGYSFFQAVDVVTKEMSGPIAEEFSILQKEMNLGLTTEKALENLVDRVSSDDLELVVTAVLIQRQVGGNLAEILDNISHTIRDRIKIKGEVKALTAQGRLSGYIISILPIALGVVLYMINPDHISVLFKDPLGIIIIGFSVMMELIGIYFVSKVVKVEL